MEERPSQRAVGPSFSVLSGERLWPISPGTHWITTIEVCVLVRLENRNHEASHHGCMRAMCEPRYTREQQGLCPFRSADSSVPNRQKRGKKVSSAATARSAPMPLSRPLDERIIFSHERLFLPMGAAGDASRSVGPAVRDPAAHRSRDSTSRPASFSSISRDKTDFMYPDYFVPAFDLTIRTEARGRGPRLRPLGRFPDRRGDGPLARTTAASSSAACSSPARRAWPCCC